MGTFITDASTTRTNIAIASRMANLRDRAVVSARESGRQLATVLAG